MIDSVEPINKEAEEKLIACCCVGESSDVLDSLNNISEDDFYLYKHKLIFRAIQHLAKQNAPIEAIGIDEYL